jgi:hypothetical protein
MKKSKSNLLILGHCDEAGKHSDIQVQKGNNNNNNKHSDTHFPLTDFSFRIRHLRSLSLDSITTNLHIFLSLSYFLLLFAG